MSSKKASEILINATRVNTNHTIDLYEFVLNDDLRVIECVRVESLAQGIIYPVQNYLAELKEVLFELNHVRVNPKLDNRDIILKLTQVLESIGVPVLNPPAQDTMAMCYRPLGEISDNVRFHFNESGKCTFLCPHAKLKAVSSAEDKDPKENCVTIHPRRPK